MKDTFTIATLPLEGGGRIGVCSLPGKSGDPVSDINEIIKWKPKMTVSMTQQAEMDQFGVGDLGVSLRQAGIDWFHLPIRDYGGLSGDNNEVWPSLALRLHEILDAGGAVLLHCRGGHGRSGMIALRLLVERGEDMDHALARLRAVRPGAVEARTQLEWAAKGAGSA